MSLIRYTGIDPFEEFESMWKRFPALAGAANMQEGFLPAVDMYETADAVKIETGLPGIDPKDVSVSVENGMLTIQGDTKKQQEVEEKNYYRKELRTGSFYRRIPLPVSVQEDGVSAEFEDGMLRITAPKSKAPEPKKIDVKVNKK